MRIAGPPARSANPMVAVGEQRTHGSRKNALRRVAATLRPCRRNRKNAANFLPQPPDKFLLRDQHFLPRRQRLQLHLRPFIPDEHRPARTQLLGDLKLFPHLHRRERKVRALSRLAQPLYQRQRTDTNRRTPGA